MIARWLVPLGGIDHNRVSVDQLHGAASRWFDDDDDDHRSNLPKPWSVTPLNVVDGVLVLTVSTLSEAARGRLLAAAQPGRPVRLGGQHGVVLSAPLHEATLAFGQRGQFVKAWCVRFLTPTAFGNGSRFSPWPDPSAVARSLVTRWNALGELDDIALTPRDSGAVWISDIDGRNIVLPVQRGLTVSGFVGRIRYVCEDKDVAARFDTLLRFAEFSGMGRYASRGLGVVRLEPTWAARSE